MHIERMGIIWPWSWEINIVAIVLIYVIRKLVSKRKEKKNLPPGPRGIPILGHFHLMGKLPHRDFHRLAQTHGPIMLLRFGFSPTVVVSSPAAAEQFLKTHDLVFASRPKEEAPKRMAFGQKNLSSSPYGPYWRTMRKFCTLHLLSNLKIASFSQLRKEELSILIEEVKNVAAKGGELSFDLSSRVSTMSTAVSCRMVFGKKYGDDDFDKRGFKYVIQEMMELVITPNLANYFPYIGVFDLQGLTRRMKVVGKVLDSFFERVIEEHVMVDSGHEGKDFLTILLSFMDSHEDNVEFGIGRDHVKATMLDMLAASMDTTATTIDWVLSELIKNPTIMKKVQEEIEQVVSMERTVEESDLEKLTYLNMVIKETLRLHPTVPLLLPHESMEDCTIEGFHIPRNSRVFINVWAIGRDKGSWTDPEMFVPERFEGTNVDLRGRDFELIPFGSGRRGCPGIQLGLVLVQFVVAQLVHCFNWKLPGGISPEELDMTEVLGIVSARAKHLVAIPTYRLHI
ncbi:cytochrome P450 71AU50-like [Impatiens glandulifera]|uniref:cytochrome P450 71AU50-like n=1 Tax=Impatiens glandulifera TaxID=253017 RepID=UPI001FB0DF73|nr:cytochrome P450 71AU50-like [Impatiens glandulifera]